MHGLKLALEKGLWTMEEGTKLEKVLKFGCEIYEPTQ